MSKLARHFNLRVARLLLAGASLQVFENYLVVPPCVLEDGVWFIWIPNEFFQFSGFRVQNPHGGKLACCLDDGGV
jgi:hypothetical protein